MWLDHSLLQREPIVTIIDSSLLTGATRFRSCTQNQNRKVRGGVLQGMDSTNLLSSPAESLENVILSRSSLGALQCDPVRYYRRATLLYVYEPPYARTCKFNSSKRKTISNTVVDYMSLINLPYYAPPPPNQPTQNGRSFGRELIHSTTIFWQLMRKL